MYAVKTEDGVVTQVIVGDPSWAEQRLGGSWLASDELVGIGWTVDGDTISPPPAPEMPDEPTVEPEFTGDLL